MEIQEIRDRIDRIRKQEIDFKKRKEEAKKLKPRRRRNRNNKIKPKTKKAPKKQKKVIKYKTKEQYHKELIHPKWKKKRKQILILDDYKCRHCESKENLQVHHTKYINGRKAWQYPNELLMTLCKDCHKKVHYLE